MSIFCKRLQMFFYGCETWSLTLREESRLRVFEDNIWAYEGGSKEWRKLHNEELNDLY